MLANRINFRLTLLGSNFTTFDGRQCKGPSTIGQRTRQLRFRVIEKNSDTDMGIQRKPWKQSTSKDERR